MALIHCPECGKEVSDQAEACIHCGYPMAKAKGERYAVVLMSLISNYNDTIKTAMEALQIDSYPDAKALIDRVPAVLRRDLDYESCVSLAKRFTPHCDMKIVRDKGEEEAVLPTLPDVSPSTREDKQGLGFGGTVLAVILGVIAALLLLSFL